MPTTILNRFLTNLCITIGVAAILATTACTQTTKEPKETRQMKPLSLQKGKPAFRLNISCEHIGFTLYLNGVTIFQDYTGLPLELEYPVNDTILNGENKLSMYINKQSPKDAQCSIDLTVHPFNDFEATPQKILTLHYNKSQIHPTDGTTPMGRYSSAEDFKPSEMGDVEVGAPTIQERQKTEIYPVDADIVSLPFHLPTPFGRWKFAGGDQILEKPYFDFSIKEIEDLKKNDPKLSKLYEINHHIYTLLKAKNIDKLLPYFKERNEEMDKAYYDSSGNAERMLRDALTKKLNNPNMELFEISEKAWEAHDIAFRVDENNQLAWLTDLILFNYIKGEGSTRYTMKFRWNEKEQKWILTR